MPEQSFEGLIKLCKMPVKCQMSNVSSETVWFHFHDVVRAPRLYGIFKNPRVNKKSYKTKKGKT